jgi:hypothetical protein
MADLSLTKFEHDGLELYIDEATGLAYAHRAAIKRMFGIESDDRTLRRRLEGVAKDKVKMAEIQTVTGLKTVALYPSEAVFKMAIEFAPDIAEKMGACGANVYLCGLAGYQITIAAKPKTALELAKEQVKLLEQIELQQTQIKLLESDNERQAEAIDELWNYSSILRVAKYNGCSEKAFEWRKLVTASKVLQVEVKKVPCPRFETKNLYSHDAWRLAYPGYRLPETTTLRISA